MQGGAGDDTLDGGPGYDVVDPRGPHEEDRFEGHDVQVFLDMRRIADVIYDERHVVVTLEGPGGLVLRELRSLVATASLTGDTDATVLFPIPDAYTEYGLSVTVSGGLIGGGSLTFNSSEVNYDQNGVFEAEPFVILSTGHNDGPQGEEPYPGYEPPYVDPPPVIAQNDGSRMSRATDGACRYCTISGGTLEITDPADGVLANDYTVSQFWPHANLTAPLADPPAHGRVTLNPDGTFTYTANPGFWGQDFFRYKATNGQHESLLATVYLLVNDVYWLDTLAHGWETDYLYISLHAGVNSPFGITIVSYDFDFLSDGVYEITGLPHDSLLWGNSLAYIPLSVLGTRPDIGSYPLTVRAVLSHGDQSKHETTVELLDTPPDVVLTVVQDAVNGGPFVVERDIILAGDDTLTTADIDWGDGSFDSIQAGQTPISHEYAQDGTYLITVDVFDSDGQYTLGPFEVRGTSVDPFTQNIPNPAPLYNELMKQLARKQMRKFADAVTIHTTIRRQATIDGFNKEQIIVPTTS